MSDLYAGLTAEQAADAEQFLAFMDEWPQDAADADPDEWARAERMATFFRSEGFEHVTVTLMLRVIRSCELFDAIAAVGAPRESEEGQP